MDLWVLKFHSASLKDPATFFLFCRLSSEGRSGNHSVCVTNLAYLALSKCMGLYSALADAARNL